MGAGAALSVAARVARGRNSDQVKRRNERKEVKSARLFTTALTAESEASDVSHEILPKREVFRGDFGPLCQWVGTFYQVFLPSLSYPFD